MLGKTLKVNENYTSKGFKDLDCSWVISIIFYLGQIKILKSLLSGLSYLLSGVWKNSIGFEDRQILIKILVQPAVNCGLKEVS